MKELEYFVTPTQKELFSIIKSMYKSPFVKNGSYILVRGEAPIMLLAHMDTVHKSPVKDICKSKDGNIIMSPQGIGGDDRCGVYALVTAYERSKIKPWLLFTCDEEIGGVGAQAFAIDFRSKRLPKALKKIKLLVEIDRKGSNDAVYYDCDNPELEEYITSKGFETDFGSFSDISEIAPEMGIAAVNLSSGYYNAHTQHEYIVRSEINAVIDKVVEIISDMCGPVYDQFKYIEAVYTSKYGAYGGWYSPSWKSNPYKSTYGTGYSAYTKNYVSKPAKKALDAYLQEMYDDLLDFYTESELEQYREEFGDYVIEELWCTEFSDRDANTM